VSYKPIASAEQSDLEFLIPADNDTYVDLNIKLYIRGKLINADGTNLDNTAFTAVTIISCTRSSVNVASL